MVSRVLEPAISDADDMPRSVKRYAGRVIYIYAYDVAYEMIRQPIQQLLASRWRSLTWTLADEIPATCFFTARK